MIALSFPRQMPRSTASGQHRFVPWSRTKPYPGHGNKMNSPHRTEQAKKKHSRRPGACEPCRKQKVQCTGGQPCNHCKRGGKKNKPKEPCWYDPEHLASRRTKRARCKKDDRLPLPVVDENSDAIDSSSHDSGPELSDAEAETEDIKSENGSPGPDEASSETHHRGPPLSYPRDEHLGQYGMLRCINQFKKLSGPSIHLLNSLAVVQCDSTEALDLMSKEGMIEPSKLIEERQEHSLRYFISEDELKQATPDIQKMAWRAINIKDYQLDQGRIYEATFEQPYLTRAYPRFKARASNSSRHNDNRQLATQKKVFKLIVDLEIRTKMHLGLPLEKEIKAEQSSTRSPPRDRGNNESSSPLDDLEASKSKYRQTALQALELLPEFDIKSPSSEKYSALDALLKQLKDQQSAFIDVVLVQNDAEALVPIADYQVEHYSFAIMLACRLALCEKFEHPPEEETKEAAPVIEITVDSSTIVELCRQLLKVFMVVTSVVQVKESPNWTRSFAAYSAAAMLTISSIQSTNPLATDKELIAKTVDYFRVATRELANNFSALASERLEKLFAELNRGPADKSTSKAPKSKQEIVKPAPLSASRAASPDAGSKRKRGTKTSSAPSSAKRQRTGSETVRSNIPSAVLDYGQTMPDVGHVASSEGLAYGNHLQTTVFENNYDLSAPSSANTSFDSSLSVDAPLYSASYGPIDPSMVPLYDTLPFEYMPEYHPPIEFPRIPLNMAFLADPSVAGGMHVHPGTARLMTAQQNGNGFNGVTTYNDSIVAAQMRANGIVSPHESIHQGPWSATDDATMWNAHQHHDSRRSSNAFTADQVRGHVWDGRTAQHMMTPGGVQQQTPELMVHQPSHMGHQHIGMTNGADWSTVPHYRHGNTLEHWPEEHQGQH